MKKYIEIEKQTREELREAFEDMLEAKVKGEEVEVAVVARIDADGDVYVADYHDEDQPDDVSYAWSIWELDPDDEVHSKADIKRLLDDMDNWYEPQAEKIIAAMDYWESQKEEDIEDDEEDED